MGKASFSDSFDKSLKSKNTRQSYDQKQRQEVKDRKVVKTLDRIDNNTYEVELENKRKLIENKIKSKNNNKDIILKELAEIQKSLRESQLTIDVLDHIQDYYDLNEIMKKTIENHDCYDRKLKRIDSDKFIRIRNTIKVIQR